MESREILLAIQIALSNPYIDFVIIIKEIRSQPLSLDKLITLV
ncbi:hypothetical protein OIU84_024067 [Salix udensis]|uniref:Uncharacterized protein n=1 Tax=Salix udensis TaxID=889485 RepID=A0AAD6KGK9_9ROSI|nr:hypothetical protein OIU84_024067 [Salix udensis]